MLSLKLGLTCVSSKLVRQDDKHHSLPLFRQQAYLNGQWTDADNGETIAVTNPATGETLGTVPNMGAAETQRALEGAEAARIEWAKRTAKDRAVILEKWYALMMQNQEALAQLLTLEMGKPLAESQGRDCLRRQLYQMVR